MGTAVKHCCHCRRVMGDFSPEFNRIGSPGAFCSRECLEAYFEPAKGCKSAAFCLYCGAVIEEPGHYLTTPGEHIKEFCSWECTNNYSRESMGLRPDTTNERALTIPDIYLAEFVGVLHRVCNKGGLTEALWGMLDHWCDAQERYLEEKYPTERKQGPCPISLHFVTKPCESAVFQGLDSFVRTGYHDPKAPEHTTANIAEELLSNVRLGSLALHENDLKYMRSLRRGQWSDELKERDIAAYGDETEYLSQEDSGLLADRLMKENNRTQTRVTFTPADGSEPVEVARVKGLDLWETPCSCRQFQGDSLECPQHGNGSAWCDLHGGE